ncbi:rhoptry-associated membrane antigen, putative [Plasmodium vinckei vinckei]|uniref:Rhoptry-associated membrane antigen, putative n=1 Tax=Plasmodium vinckei vinckei TaxID=54757 RepID=A0A449BTP5_PLAVN|nr:rhoptry-associated membrane antigen, putative [Plasmodium vinckei vinckei]KEG02915.1 hypothetical protein YYE_01846 [Plasmodium vinckei vinckei]VEV56719.1 rhoptry-associated membrane antigen, putative [Plasmodium vinckei vinckei]
MKILLSLLVFQNITTYFDNFKNAAIIENNGGNIQYINENIVSSINKISRQLNEDIELSKYDLITDKYYYDSNAQKDYYDAKEFKRDLGSFGTDNENKNKESFLKDNNEKDNDENGKSFLETDEYDDDNEKDEDNEYEESFLETDEYDEEADNEKDEDNEYEESFLETDEYDEEADNEKDEDEHDESFLEADEYDEEADNENDEDNKNEESFLEADEYDDDNENDESFLETDEYDEEADNEKDEDNEYEESFLETDEYDEEADNEKDEDMDDDNYANNINSSITAQSFIETNDIYSDDLFDSEETIKDAVKKGNKNKNSSASSINDSTKDMIKKLNKTGSTEFKNNQSLRSHNKNSTKSNIEDIKAKNTKNNMDQTNLEEHGFLNDEFASDMMPSVFDAVAPKFHKKEKLGNESTKNNLKSNTSAKNLKHVPYKRGENQIFPHIHTDAYKKNKKLDEILEEYEKELSGDDMMELESHNEEDTPIIGETDDPDNDDDPNEPNSSSISFLSSLTLIILGLLYIMN